MNRRQLTNLNLGVMALMCLSNSLFAAQTIGPFEEYPVFVVHEWNKGGFVAALTDPDTKTVTALVNARYPRGYISTILKTLDEPTRQKLIPVLEAILRDENRHSVRVAAEALGYLGRKDKAIPVLEKLLLLDDEREAMLVPLAAESLGQIGATQSIPALETLLEAQSGITFRFVVDALWSLGAKEKVIAVAKKRLGEDANWGNLSTRDDEVLKLAQALTRMGAPHVAIAQLEKLLSSQDQEVIVNAANALGKLGATKSIPLLEKLLQPKPKTKPNQPGGYKPLSPSNHSNYVVAAAIALGELGSTNGKPVLKAFLTETCVGPPPDGPNIPTDGHKPDNFIIHAARIFSRLDDKGEAAALLQKCLTNSDVDLVITAALALEQLKVPSNAISVLEHLLDDKSKGIARAAADVLVELGIEEKVVATYDKLISLNDRSFSEFDYNFTTSERLGRLRTTSAMPRLEKWLTSHDARILYGAARGLMNSSSIKPIPMKTVLGLLDRCYGHVEEIGVLRVFAHILGRGERENEISISCLGKNDPASCELVHLKADTSHEYLQTFRSAWDASETFPDLRKDLADKIGKLARAGNWSAKDLEQIKYFKQQFEKHGSLYASEANMLSAAITAADRGVWFKWLGYGWIAHALFWLALIFVYPRSPQVQAIFFWNKWVRKFAGFFYVGPLLTWVPFLRNRLLAPFREALLADADLKNFDPDRYFADCSVRLKPNGQSRPIDQSIPAIHGQTILEGESGLGKTMFLRRFASRATRPTVYLLAHRCEAGVMEGIQSKLFGYAQDKDFLQSLVYSGAMDLCIDGLNEVSPDTRAQVSNFLDRFVKSNVLIGTQPLEWTPPKTARVFVLEPLSPERIESFLLTRVDELPDDVTIKGREYESACKAYLARTLGQSTGEDAKQTTLRMLSNPMDLTVVSLMLARGAEPDYFHLREQQYRIMAADYQSTNVNKPYPLKAFSEHCYQMRLQDETAIDSKEYQQELLCMERHKMVVKRQYYDADKKLQTEWHFRHDKVMEFFIVQTFLGPGNGRPQQHLGDGRFRGVYLLLATFLPIEAANALREQLILYAAQTQDHTVSDTFVQLLHGRKTA